MKRAIGIVGGTTGTGWPTVQIGHEGAWSIDNKNPRRWLPGEAVLVRYDRVRVGEGIGRLKTGVEAVIVQGPITVSMVSGVYVVRADNGEEEQVHESRLSPVRATKQRHRMSEAEFEQSAENRYYREIFLRYVKAVETVERIDAGGVGGTGRIPTAGSYRGTFKQALVTNHWQWEASQQRDREHAEWLQAMEPFQKEADECLEKLRKAARAYVRGRERTELRSMSAEGAYRVLVRALHRKYVERGQ